ncbi:polyketide synthase type 1 [Penicillium malachiteum]|uniref:Polyketide synthase type 1 n=1 Tax=Penicillium malachiteum TaxID=1324776 RepID=A0AAD6HN46_9EURO|nr:polyketide synthase type 1 [Penicillium malachiteum]
MAQIESVAHLLKKHAETRGHQIAFSTATGGSVTYYDLEVRTRQIARNLLNAGISRGCRVAIVLASSIEAIESNFAITRAAAVGVSLDARSSQAELTRAFENSYAKLIITDHKRLSRVCAAISEKVKIDKVIVLVVNKEGTTIDFAEVEGITVEQYEDWSRHDLTTSNLNHHHALQLDNLGLNEPAWLFHTTGTTGHAKGVFISQYAFMWTAVNSLQVASSLNLTAADKIFWPLPLFHAFGHSLCVIGTLSVGASAHLVGDQPLLDSLLQSKESTIIGGAPAIFQELTKSTARQALAQIQPRICIASGAAAPKRLSAEVESLFGVPLSCQYGSTECGLIATNSGIPGGIYSEASCRSPPQGVGVQIRTLDPGGQLLAEAADEDEGEICVRTPSFMLGYNDGSLSSSTLQDGWYRTGDLGRQEDIPGTGQRILTVTGRIKEVMIRGRENIHPLEVEDALCGSPGVADVVVAGIPHEMLGEVPVAFIEGESDTTLEITKLLKQCRTILPDYKVPVKFYNIDAIPRTASGKPKRLAAVDLLRNGTACRLIAPPILKRDNIQCLVLTECTAVCGSGIGLEQLDPDESFLRIGLNSMKSMVLRDRLAYLTSLELPITFVFDHPTPVAVTQYLQKQLFKTGEQDETPILTEEAPGFEGQEQIAIVSMGCRYPGGISSPDDLWKVVSEGLDVTSDFPPNRDWNIDALYHPESHRAGTSTVCRGGFIYDMADFDAEFFGMSPREALATDPQQRLLLETTHSLIERAGIAPASLRGTSTDVFVGVIVAAGRISYSFDFKGPFLAIDSACSSSISAIHMAAASLLTRESDLAIAGGVAIMSTPRTFISFSRQKALSKDGYCRPYSADATGTSFSEGVGLLLLERLSDARRNGHNILSIIRGSAINSDGASFGLTAPNGKTQKDVLSQTLRRAGLSPADVDVLDGHGTATVLGDPIELGAVLRVYGNRPLSNPLLIGSVKSNLGHTQAAAGIASVIKMVKSMQYGIAPASLHIWKPTPHVDWTSGAVELLSEVKNPEQSPENLSAKSMSAHPWILSGASDAALKVQARNMIPLCNIEDSLDVAFFLATTRSHLPHRAAVIASTADGIQDALVALAEGRTHPDVFTGKAKAGRSGLSQSQSSLAFIFSGQGSQRVGMGQKLCIRFPCFKAAFQEACEIFDTQLEPPLSGVINNSGINCKLSLLDRTDYAQAAVFVFEVAMFRLLESLGIRPDYVAGHSLGEISAAHVAGYLSLTDAATLVTARGTLMAALPEGGSMLSISATEDEINKVIQNMDLVATAAVAAINAQDSAVVSGPSDVILAVNDIFIARGRSTTQLRVSHAFYSPMMGPVLAPLHEQIAQIFPFKSTATPSVRLLSTVTGKLVNENDLTSDHWLRHVLSPVHLADAIVTLSDNYHVTTFVEIGHSAPLCRHITDGIPISSGKRHEVDALLMALGQLWARGIQTHAGTLGQEWEFIFKGSGARKVDLPVYPFQRQTYWLKAPSVRSVRSVSSSGQESAVLLSPASSPSSPTSVATPKTNETHLKAPESQSSAESCAWEDELSKIPSSQPRPQLLKLVLSQVSAVLGYQDHQSIPSSAWDTTLTDLGCDSFLGTLLRGKLGHLVSVLLPIDLISNEATSTIQALVDYLLAHMVLVDDLI